MREFRVAVWGTCAVCFRTIWVQKKINVIVFITNVIGVVNKLLDASVNGHCSQATRTKINRDEAKEKSRSLSS